MQNIPPNTLRTNSGLYLDFLNPTIDMICIEDIAQGLSHESRFGGQLDELYTVAQHSVHVSGLCEPKHKLAALLHDASEAYLKDIPKPLKRLLPNYQNIEENLMQVIALKFGFSFPLSNEIKAMDKHMYIVEVDSLIKKKFNLYCWNPSTARSKFLEEFKVLTNLTEKHQWLT